MSIHRSLKTTSGSLNQHRNVLTRAERITKLGIESRFDPEKNAALGLAKVRSIKAVVAKKKKVEGEGEAGAVDPKAAAPAAGAVKAAAPATGKAPAGKAPAGKAAAPAAKGAPKK